MNQTALDRVKRWVDVARWASSGDNSQPWKVRVEEEGLPAGEFRVLLDLRDQVKATEYCFDVEHVGHYLCLGSFARNLELLAREDGCELKGMSLANGLPFVLGFAVTGEGDGSGYQRVAERVRTRRVNRFPWRRDSVAAPLTEKWRELAEREGVRFHAFTQRKDISKIAGLFFQDGLGSLLESAFLE